MNEKRKRRKGAEEIKIKIGNFNCELRTWAEKKN